MADLRKQSIYIPLDMLRDMREEATRQQRSLSWIVQRCWRMGRADMRKMPSAGFVSPAEGIDDDLVNKP